MYYYKLFIWKNGKKETDLTNYLLAPIFLEDRLNEELSTGEVILDAVPRELYPIPFAPKTKMRIERYRDKDFKDRLKYWDMVIEHDDIEEYTGCPQYLCHRIHLIEPSVIAQGMHVDNIALTYELQDVTTEYKTYRTDTTKVVPDTQNIEYYKKIHLNKVDKSLTSEVSGVTKGYFENSYAYNWDKADITKLANAIKKEYNVRDEHTIEFDIPKLYCYGSSGSGEFDKQLFQIPVFARVIRYKTQNDTELYNTREVILEQESGPASITSANDDWYYSDGKVAALRTIDKNANLKVLNYFKNIYSQDSVISQVKEYKNHIKFTTPSLSVTEAEDKKKGYKYVVELRANPVNANGMIIYFSVETFTSSSLFVQKGEFKHYINEKTNPDNIYINTDFQVHDMSSDKEYGNLIKKGIKYSCLDLIRKALLTVDTQILDNNINGLDEFYKDETGAEYQTGIEYPILIDPAWHDRLFTAKVQETVLENKNLWEVFLQIGYYLHAIPELKFAENGTDRFILTFKQLGNTKKNESKSNKITVFNSQNLSEFFTQYDSYVTNIFSPQNVVEEWLVCKTGDESMLVSNNTAILQTKYGISEVVEFDIWYDGTLGGQAGTKSALRYIFEKSIYQILTADYLLTPSKGEALYYELGQNTISGLNYVPPSKNNDTPMALKRIISKLFSGASINKLKFNNLKFHIKYRTQDSMRVSQIRPDLQNFMKNSSYEKYPHHEQFYGQQDKIIDSERFSLNLFGKLIRVGNCIYQRQEQVLDGQKEKEAGDLVEINDEPYYVVTVENEYYNTVTLQKVTYSKNFNQLSQIVTIPSEPRFYEVSERSKIRREKREFDFFTISTKANESNTPPRFLAKESWKSFIKNIIFYKEELKLPNYAWTRFMADKKRQHQGQNTSHIEIDKLFPSSELDRTDKNNIVPKALSDHADCIVPLLHFPIKDGIIFEWDMEDNFKAGDCIDTELQGNIKTVDDAYVAQQSVRYCDIFGRADLYTFRLFHKTDWSYEESQALPKACIEPKEEECQAYLSSKYAIGLDKDCREELSFNYQISLLYKNDGEGEIITFSNLFGRKDNELYCILIDEEISQFNENTTAIKGNVLADRVAYELIEDKEREQVEIRIKKPIDIDLTKVKAVVFYETDNGGYKVSYLAKNFKNGIQQEEIPSLYIYPVFNTEQGEKEDAE